ncbi:MAG: NAD(P)/FAD-dependent oxidoreductase [Sumerlaeia bacterium]
MSNPDVVIIGAGLAGLACARHLVANGVAFHIYEASDGPGGRVRTDLVDGYSLDRGFQVLLTAYPECRRVLDYDALELKAFHPGAMIWRDGRFHMQSDPMRQPSEAFATLFANIGTFRDKLRVLSLRSRAMKGDLAKIFSREETSALDVLRDIGFSPAMIEAFWRPFLGGIFLTHALDQVSSRMLDFVIRMMAKGDTAIPARGIQAIPDQLAAALPKGSITYTRAVAAIEGQDVLLQDGERVTARAIVVATDAPAAARLLDRKEEASETPGRGVACLYFVTKSLPVHGPWLMLNGETAGPINNLHWVDQVNPAQTQTGTHLLSVSVLDFSGQSDDELSRNVRDRLASLFGAEARRWHHLKTYRIPHAQPLQTPPSGIGNSISPKHRDGLYVCGDHRLSASLDGALRSGRYAAEAIISESHNL